MKNLETLFERLLFSSRWLMAPIYLGLVIAMLLLLYKFGKELWGIAGNLFITQMATTDMSSGAYIITSVLTLVDIALIMNLLIIIIFSGYENFVSKMDELREHKDRPDWMGYIGFTDLKIKLIGSIVAISSIELLKAFMTIDKYDDRHLTWMMVFHLGFVISGVLYAWMDRLNRR